MKQRHTASSVGIKRRENLQYYLMAAPFLLAFFVFTLLPILQSVALSFFDYDMVSMPDFAGLKNYVRMFVDDDVFGIVVKNTIIFAVAVGPAGFLLSFVLAWFINEFRPTVRAILSFLFYCPSLIGNAYFVWQVAFSNDSYGYVNSLLLSIGLISEPINWFKDAHYVMPILIMIQLWQSMGVSFLANISGLQNVNGELYEAGAIDGVRNRWQELWYITLPSMKNMLLFSAVMSIANSFSVSAVAVTLAGYPSVGHAVDTIVSHISDLGTVRFEMGYASALSVFLFLLMVAVRWLINRVLQQVGR